MSNQRVVGGEELGAADSDTNFYAARLAGVNQDHVVLTTTDIVNANGVILVRKGVRIDSNIAERILRHKLIKPLEEQVAVADGLNGQRLAERFACLHEKYPDLGHLHDRLGSIALCNELSVKSEFHTMLWQKLTVLEHELPSEFEKGLFCAGLAALLARELKLSHQDIQSAFLAGLTHDAGLLHIDPAILNKNGPLTPPEWRAIQSHVITGRMLLDHLPGVSSAAADAVMQHHERCDGTGYPVGTGEDQLGLLGQVVAIADSVQAIRVRQFEKLGRNLYDTLPYLNLNAYTHFYSVFQAMVSVLKRSGLSQTLVDAYGGVATMGLRLQQRGESLQEAVGYLQAMVDSLETSNIRSCGQHVLRSARRVQTMMVSSGLVRIELTTWLGSLAQEPDESVLAELNEIDLMQNELRWQIRNLLRAFGEFYDLECKDDSCGALALHAERLEDCLKAAG
ncbi:MAG: HD domain-containing protein [Gammaproteobacteria bacterium]|nr:HD domain-containing protein [Gammaproteobacteria bacterium]MBU2479264.1 HD domain-containing protein [Gammaproteobacteria bacterium]